LVEKKQQVKNCDSTDKQETAVAPIHGILKNRFKHVFERRQVTVVLEMVVKKAIIMIKRQPRTDM